MDRLPSFSPANSSDFIIVFNRGVGFFHAGFQLSEAVGNGKAEPTAILVVDHVAPAENVALHGEGFKVLMIVEKGIGGKAHGEAVVAEERALQRERIAIVGFIRGIDALACTANLSVSGDSGLQFPRQFLREVEIVPQIGGIQA